LSQSIPCSVVQNSPFEQKQFRVPLRREFFGNTPTNGPYRAAAGSNNACTAGTIAHGTKQISSALIAASLQRRWLMKAVLPLFFTGLLGLGATGASAQIAPGDPAG